MTVLRSNTDLLLRDLEERDIGLLARWRSDPRVMENYAIYRGEVSEAQVRSAFLQSSASPEPDTGLSIDYHACIAEDHGRPVAFVQFHRLRSSDAELVGYPRDEQSYEMDLFVGDVGRWGQGLGSRIIGLTRDFLRDGRGAGRVIAVPVADNARSIRAFESAGFRTVRIIAAAYASIGRGDGVLMECP